MLAVTAPHWLVFVDTLRRSMTTYDQPRVLFADVAMAPVMLLGPLSPVMGLPAMHLVAMILLVAAATRCRLGAGPDLQTARRVGQRLAPRSRFSRWRRIRSGLAPAASFVTQIGHLSRRLHHRRAGTAPRRLRGGSRGPGRGRFLAGNGRDVFTSLAVGGS